MTKEQNLRNQTVKVANSDEYPTCEWVAQHFYYKVNGNLDQKHTQDFQKMANANGRIWHKHERRYLEGKEPTLKKYNRYPKLMGRNTFTVNDTTYDLDILIPHRNIEYTRIYKYNQYFGWNGKLFYHRMLIWLWWGNEIEPGERIMSRANDDRIENLYSVKNE